MLLSDSAKIAAVVVTYNRKKLLMTCLQALACQSRCPDFIVLVDNASVDGTSEDLSAAGWLERSDFSYIRLPENLGGAGGFKAGLQAAIELGASWMWLMDDDAAPHLDALEQLERTASDIAIIYGSAAVQGESLSWRMVPLHDRSQSLTRAKDLPDMLDVVLLPFLGFFVHRNVVQNIGLPDAGFFIAADDVEYCWRARSKAIRTVLVGRSRIEHPAAAIYDVTLLGHRFACLKLPPWKRYYDTRNRILLARAHFGARIYSETLPGLLVRLAMTLTTEPRRMAQLGAFLAGLADGMLGIKGRRHEFWRIKP